MDLPNSRSLSDFNKSLETRRSRTVDVFNPPHTERLRVRALGHISPDQFRELTAPAYHMRDWDDLQDEVLERNVEYKMDDLRRSVGKHGVVRPVIIDNVATSVTSPKGEDVKKQVVIDGNHRAAAAVRLGLTIPTYVLHESEKWNWY